MFCGEKILFYLEHWRIWPFRVCDFPDFVAAPHLLSLRLNDTHEVFILVVKAGPHCDTMCHFKILKRCQPFLPLSDFCHDQRNKLVDISDIADFFMDLKKLCQRLYLISSVETDCEPWKVVYWGRVCTISPLFWWVVWKRANWIRWLPDSITYHNRFWLAISQIYNRPAGTIILTSNWGFCTLFLRKSVSLHQEAMTLFL